jgi:hypothetical protein
MHPRTFAAMPNPGGQKMVRFDVRKLLAFFRSVPL